MQLKSSLFEALYHRIFRPLAFARDPEMVHDKITVLGEHLENQKALVSWAFAYQTPTLNKEVLGVAFDNPVGLAAGFDYDGHLAQVMRHVGFGFNTVGTVTARPYEGNPKPRLARLPKSRSLMVNKGFKSEGARTVARRLDKKKLSGHTVGISVGSSNILDIDSIEKAIEDYLFTFKVFRNKQYVKYFELNISCPNTALPEPFTNPENFNRLVTALAKLKLKQPIFVKMPNEITNKKSDELVRIAISKNIRGFVFSNLVKDRNNHSLVRSEIRKLAGQKGNFSGKPTEAGSNKLITHTRQKFGKQVAIIGTGGIFCAKDAQAKLTAGADLVQLITGMIYQGPQLPGQICREFANSRPKGKH